MMCTARGRLRGFGQAAMHNGSSPLPRLAQSQ